jgi:uncharacterized protein YndB with AHSA1/START domain
MSVSTTDLTIRKSVVVAAPLERAFEVFTERITAWWPLATHSIGADKAESVDFEGRVGGRLVEQIAGGEEASWATITAWEPPTRIAMRWHVNPENPETEIEVRFQPEGDGTRVDLEHRGWDAFGDQAQDMSGGYTVGWGMILERYADTAGE